MPLAISLVQIEAALPRVANGLRQYLWLQENYRVGDVRHSNEFRTRFNHFYRVRRGIDWQLSYYGLMEEAKQREPSFLDILIRLHRATGNCEASYVSKLVATINPRMPVLDKFVLRSHSFRLPTGTLDVRFAGISALHSTVKSEQEHFLSTSPGEYLVRRFVESYPGTSITSMKMLDFVLWQTRPNQAL